jgi:hypothetical protein
MRSHVRPSQKRCMRRFPSTYGQVKKDRPRHDDADQKQTLPLVTSTHAATVQADAERRKDGEACGEACGSEA